MTILFLCAVLWRILCKDITRDISALMYEDREMFIYATFLRFFYVSWIIEFCLRMISLRPYYYFRSSYFINGSITLIATFSSFLDLYYDRLFFPGPYDNSIQVFRFLGLFPLFARWNREFEIYLYATTKAMNAAWPYIFVIFSLWFVSLSLSLSLSACAKARVL